MIETKQDLMEIVDHYIKAKDFDSAINFIENYPMPDVAMITEIKRVENLKYGIKTPTPIVEKIEPENVKVDGTEIEAKVPETEDKPVESTKEEE